MVCCLVQCQEMLCSSEQFLVWKNQYIAFQAVRFIVMLAMSYHLEYRRSVFGCLPSVGQSSSESWLACLLGTSEWQYPLPRLVAHCRQLQSWSFAGGWLGSYYQSALNSSEPVRDSLYQETRQVLPYQTLPRMYAANPRRLKHSSLRCRRSDRERSRPDQCCRGS